jgi:hypothetical protein
MSAEATGEFVLEEAETVLDRTVASWEQSAPANDILPYYRQWPHVPILDSVYTCRATLRNFHELFWFRHVLHPETRMPVRPLPAYDEIAPPSDFALSPEFISETDGTFRIHPGDQVSLYAIDVGLRIAYEALSQGRGEDWKQWEGVVRNAGRRLSAEFESHGQDGMLPAIQGARPSIFGALSAVSALSNYRRLIKLIPDLPSVELDAGANCSVSR